MIPKILKENLLFDGFLKIKESILEYKKGEETITVVNSKMIKNNAVAILVFNIETQSIVLTQQYRYPIADQEGEELVIEIPAGTIEEGETPKETAIREVKEEVGYNASEIDEIMEYYPSPGYSTEKVHLFLCVVKNNDKIINEGGGLNNEGEFIKSYEVPINDAYKIIEEGGIRDAKSIIAIQEFKIKHVNFVSDELKDEIKNLQNKISNLETKLVLLQSKPKQS